MSSPGTAVEKVFGLEETRSPILRHLRPSDIKTMSSVSRYWNFVLEKPRFWQAFQIKLTAENCPDILQNENISLKRISIILNFSTNSDTFQDTSMLLSVMRELKDDPNNRVKKLKLYINCNSDLGPSQLTAFTTSMLELSSVLSSMEEVEMVFMPREVMERFNHNHMIGFILSFLLDSLVKQHSRQGCILAPIMDNERGLKRLDILGLGMSNISRYRKNIASHLVHLKHTYSHMKMDTDLRDPHLVKILHKLNMSPLH